MALRCYEGLPALAGRLGVVLCVLCSTLVAHDNSRSRTLLVVEHDHLAHFVKLQAQSVWEVLPLDADGNLLVEPAEFEAVKSDLAQYVGDHVLLRPDGGERLRGSLVAAELVSNDSDALAFEQWIEVELRYELERSPRDLEIEVSLFAETSPRHQDLCDVLWSGGLDEQGEGVVTPVRLRFWAGDSRQLASSGRPETALPFWAGVGSGVRRWLQAPLAWLCLAALLAGAGGRNFYKGSARVLLAFVGSLAGGLVWAEAMPEPVSVGALALAGGLAVIWVGALNMAELRHSTGEAPQGRPVWAEALVFGLLMGLGLAEYEGPLTEAWQLGAGAAAVSALTGAAAILFMGQTRRTLWMRRGVSLAAMLGGGWVAVSPFIEWPGSI
ncbi:MAG: hypothetical protein ACI9EF_000801 [Pseudohongiellaceae bacterium]|jgi:hypothetical protein